MKNKGFSLFAVIGFICISSIISAITVGVIITNSYKSTSGTLYSDLVKDEDLKEFLNVYESIVDSYYEDVDKKEILNNAVSAMLNYLDDNYTTYMNSEEKEELARRLEGSYRGIGISILGCTIEAVTENTPAARAGMQAGDIIVKVDDVDLTTCEDGSKITSLIKNNDKKEVKVSVKRNEEILDFTLSPEKIIVSAVDSKMIENTDIGYIGISIFSSNIGSQFKTALTDLKNKGMQKLIIDVRQNSGGYLDGAKDIASQILPKGKLIYTLQTKDKKTKYYDETSEKLDMPIVVLIDSGSASSSEILTAALKDSMGVTVIGEKSYGKGKVQQTYDLDDGGLAKLTTALWLRPNGECVDGIGITPDIASKITTVTDANNNQVEEDNPLNQAIQKLK